MFVFGNLLGAIATILDILLQTLLIVILVSLPFQFLFLVLPPGWINMPHREYWLAPERRAGTLERLNAFGTILFGIILLAVQAGFEIAAYANLRTPIVFNASLMSAVIAATLVLAGVLLVLLVLSFRLPPEGSLSGRQSNSMD